MKVIDLLVLTWLGLTVLSCGNERTQERKSMATPVPLWQQFKSGGIVGVADLYIGDAIKLRSDGEVIQGAEKIAAFHRNSSMAVDSLWTAFEVQANRHFRYEIGGFSSQRAMHYHLLILDTLDRRVFEFIEASESNNWQPGEIDQARNRWMELCNAHDAALLVEEMYAEKSQYFSHRPLVSKVYLPDEYSYMNRPNYSLTLTPLHLQTVTNDLALEIGQCSGSYGGKYMIIWQRSETSPWQVLFDSNI